MSAQPGEVWTFVSLTKPKNEPKIKHHLCVGDEGMFLFVSTYRRKHRGSMTMPNAEVPFLPPTESGKSAISCTTVIRRKVPDPSVPPSKMKGKVRRGLMAELLRYVRTVDELTDRERDIILDMLYDYYGTDLV